MLGVALMLASCGQERAGNAGEENVPAGEESESAGRAVGVSVADVTDNPDELYGKQMTLSGLVTDVVGPNAVARVINPTTFVIVEQQSAEDEGLYGADAEALAEEGVLVTTGGGTGPNLTERQTVRVKGTLRQFDATAFEQDLGVRYDGNDEYLSAFSDRPAIVASQVQPK